MFKITLTDCYILFLLLSMNVAHCNVEIITSVSEDACSEGDKGCFSFSFDSIDDLEEQLRNDQNVMNYFTSQLNEIKVSGSNDKKECSFSNRLAETTTEISSIASTTIPTTKTTTNTKTTTTSTTTTNRPITTTTAIATVRKWTVGQPKTEKTICKGGITTGVFLEIETLFSLQHYSVTFSEAKRNCNNSGGRLASTGIIDGSIVSALKRHDCQGPYWIGLEFLNNIWTWSDGSAYNRTTTIWGNNQPDKEMEIHAALYFNHSDTPNTWNIHDYSENSGHKFSYICEVI